MQRPWLQPGPACHMLRDELRSAEQACPAGFLAPGHRRQTRGASYSRWRKRREGLGRWDWACKAPSWFLAVGRSAEQVGGIKGRVGGSQDASQAARMGLLRAADGGLGVSAALPGTEPPRCLSLAAPTSLVCAGLPVFTCALDWGPRGSPESVRAGAFCSPRTPYFCVEPG